MATSSQWSSLGVSLSSLGMSNNAADAMNYAQEAYAREKGAGATDMKMFNQQLQNIQANIRAGQEQAKLFAPDMPEGFVPIREIKILPQMGRWKPLSDRLPPWFPRFGHLVERQKKGDKEAAQWIDLYVRGLKGEADAQRELGKAAESGAMGSSIDPQRAFFWYYRAGLQGDGEAREAALRLKGTTQIDPATMQEPEHLYAGVWTLTSDSFGQASATNLLELKADGSLIGRVTGMGGQAANLMNNALAAMGDPFMQNFVSSMFQSVSLSGRWQFDKSRFLLALGITATIPGMPGGQTENYVIEIYGWKEGGALLGRDKKMTTHILAPYVQEKAGK